MQILLNSSQNIYLSRKISVLKLTVYLMAQKVNILSLNKKVNKFNKNKFILKTFLYFREVYNIKISHLQLSY